MGFSYNVFTTCLTCKALFISQNDRTKKAKYCPNCKINRKMFVAKYHYERKRKNASA